MATLTKSEIAALSVDERLALIDDLWESIEEPLDKRIDDADQFPEKSVPWEIARAELAKKWLS
jgi:putative addiction module component (TIGR02574 family)